MSETRTNYKEVYDLYQMYSKGKDLKEFCHEAGVQYSKLMDWQRKYMRLSRQIMPSDYEKQSIPCTMVPVTVTGKPDVATKQDGEPDNEELVKSIKLVSVLFYDGTKVSMKNTSLYDMFKFFQKIIG